MLVDSLNYDLEETLVLVAHEPSPDDIDNFRDNLKSDADLLVELIGAMHGPTALSIFGSRIASYKLEHDLDKSSYVGILRTATRPSCMRLDEFLSDIATVWNLSPLATGEVYKL